MIMLTTKPAAMMCIIFFTFFYSFWLHTDCTDSQRKGRTLSDQYCS